MDDVHDAETEPSGRYLRLPWPLVAAGLLGLLAIALAVGLFANRALRPQVAPSPTAPPAAAALPTAASPLPATAAPTPAPTRAVSALASPTASPPPVTVPPTPVSTPVTPSPRPTLDAALVAEVSAGYEQYWRIRSQALLDLDKTHLSEVMGGDHMIEIAQLIDQLRSENRAIKTDVNHDIQVIQANTDTARLVDDYISNSIYVDPVTKGALTDTGSDELVVLCRLTKSNGVWRVVDSVLRD